MTVLAFTLGLVLALGQAAAFGPVNAETLRRGMHGGFRPAFLVQIGSLLGDSVWALAAILGAEALDTRPLFARVGQLLGVVLLAWLAVAAWREAATRAGASADARWRGARLPPFWAGLALGVVNPSLAAFWVGVGTTLLASRLPEAGPLALGQFALGYYLADLVWALFFASLSWQAGLRFSARLQRPTNQGVAVLLTLLAGLSLLSLMRGPTDV